MMLSELAKKDAHWWLTNVKNLVRCIQRENPQVTLQSDASGLGWGATNGVTHIGGRWNADERMQVQNINFLELLAAFFALQSFCKDHRNIHVRIQIDNVTAVTYINKMGGIKSSQCDRLARKLWEWCIARKIWVSAAHLPGAQNTIADRKSRVFKDETEWKLDSKVFLDICKVLGHANIDLFATRLNTQLPRYVSWLPDPGAEAVDAFTVDWGKELFYAFPPFCLIDKCLQKVNNDEAEGILVVPKWPTQVWFPRLLQMLVDYPILLPRTKQILSLENSNVVHPLHNKLYLLSCRVSWSHSKQEEFRKQLETSFWPPGENQLGSNMELILQDGKTFVLNGQVIRCRQL